jgi:hypothetical protein
MLVPPSASLLTPESKGKDKNISCKATAFRAHSDLNDVVREDEGVGG